MQAIPSRALDVVEEFLRFNGFAGTLAALNAEVEPHKKSATFGQEDGTFWRTQALDGLVSDFEHGKRQSFWAAWERYVSTSARQTDADAKRIELDLHVYFLTRELKNEGEGTKVAKEHCVEALRKFLDGPGAVLVQSGECIHYCALPFAHEPWETAQLKPLFAPEFRTALKARMQTALPNLLRQPASPVLYQLLNQKSSVRRQGGKAETEIAELALEVASELLASLEVLMIEGKKPLDSVLGVKSRVRNLQNALQDSKSQLNSGDSAEISSFVPVNSGGEWDGGSLSKRGAPGFKLDVDKVRATLAGPPGNLRSLTLQALRWRLVRAGGRVECRRALAELVAGDFLSVREGEGVLRRLLLAEGEQGATGREHGGRLIHTVASLNTGRDYLLRLEGGLAEVLFEGMKSQVRDTRVRQQLLATLQKCSRRKLVQDKCIRLHVVAWLVELLEDTERLAPFTVQYGAALLLNLAQTRQGLDECCELQRQLLPTLVDLLEYDSQDVCEYVHGLLLLLMRRRAIRHAARERGLDDILRALHRVHRASDNRQLAEQVQTLLETLEEKAREEEEEGYEDEEFEGEGGEEEEEEGDGEEGGGGGDGRVQAEEGPADQHDVVKAGGEFGGREGSELLYELFRAEGEARPDPPQQESAPPTAPPPPFSPSQPRAPTAETPSLRPPQPPSPSTHHPQPSPPPPSPPVPAQPEAPASPSRPASSYSNDGFESAPPSRPGSSRAPSTLPSSIPPHPTTSSPSPAPPSTTDPASSFVGGDTAGTAPSDGGGGGGEGEGGGGSPARVRRLATPSQEKLDRVQSKASQQSSVTVEEMKEAFGGRSKLPRTPLHEPQ